MCSWQGSPFRRGSRVLGLIVPVTADLVSPGSMAWFHPGARLERGGESRGTSDTLVGVELPARSMEWLQGLLYGRRYALAIKVATA